MEAKKLLNTPISDWRIVISANGNYVEQKLAIRLTEAFMESAGVSPSVSDDSKPVGPFEILLGNTNRTENEALAPCAWSVKGTGGRIEIRYGSTFAAETAIDSMFTEALAEDAIDLTGEVEDVMDIAHVDGMIRIMSSNVLFTGDTKTTGLPYEKRADMLADMYLTWKPDILGLQEARGGISDRIMSYVGGEYTIVCQAEGRHTPILYRTDAWRPVLDEAGEPIQKTEMFFNGHCWDYEWIMLEQIATGKKIIVGNLHFQPRGYCGDMRTVAMQIFNTEVKRLETVYPDIPLFFTGDYNTTRNTRRMADKDWKDGWEDIVTGTHLMCAGQMCTATPHGRNIDPNGNLIDHVTMSYHLVKKVKHFRRVRYATMLKSSDHQPVFADIELK